MNWLKRGEVTWGELGVVGLVLAAFAALALIAAIPEYLRERDARRARECQENLIKIDGAKGQYALEHNGKPGFQAGWSDIIDPYGGTGYLKAMPLCPAGYGYTINPIGTGPECESHLRSHAVYWSGTP